MTSPTDPPAGEIQSKGAEMPKLQCGQVWQSRDASWTIGERTKTRWFVLLCHAGRATHSFGVSESWKRILRNNGASLIAGPGSPWTPPDAT